MQIHTSHNKTIIKISQNEWNNLGKECASDPYFKYARKNGTKIYNFAKNGNKPEDVAFKGILKQKKNGFTYLDVADGVINGLFALIDSKDAEKSPKQGIGAHISVFHEEEIEGIKIKELGKEFEFTLGEMKKVKPEGWKEMKLVYFIQVKSPKLEELRKSYKLTKKIYGHEFHITIAVEKK